MNAPASECDGAGAQVTLRTSFGDGQVGRCGECGQIVECFDNGDARSHTRSDALRLFA